jgi:hypothetical protein
MKKMRTVKFNIIRKTVMIWRDKAHWLFSII